MFKVFVLFGLMVLKVFLVSMVFVLFGLVVFKFDLHHSEQRENLGKPPEKFKAYPTVNEIKLSWRLWLSKTQFFKNNMVVDLSNNNSQFVRYNLAHNILEPQTNPTVDGEALVACFSH